MDFSAEVPRPEHPRPSWVRESWRNLNGWWEFALDPACRESVESVRFDRKIRVPFSPESELSGIGSRDFMECLWYRRTIEIPPEWKGKRILLHFQAIDYDAEIYIDGKLLRRHRGCFTPVTVDLGLAKKNAYIVTLRAQTLRDRNRARGKQSSHPENYLCCYTRTSGIWQTVWMEAVPEIYLKRPRVLPIAEGFLLTVPLSANRRGWSVRARIVTAGRSIAAAKAPADSGFSAVLALTLPESERRFWSPEDPFLYDIIIELRDENGNVIDCGRSYGGWRFLTIDGLDFRLNGKKIFQKLILDQGYYPDGIWTAPDDAALIRDIELAMRAGFNGARLHQKVFEERFLYHADRLGYLVWGEFGDWGIDWESDGQPPAGLYQPGISPVAQFLEELERDFSHPALIGWSALNETHRRTVQGTPSLDVVDDLTRAMFNAAKYVDPSRPVLDVSGYIHRLPESDVYDSHDYGLPEEVALHLAQMRIGEPCDPNPERQWNEPWHGQPFFLSEIGGIAWPPPDKECFSYGAPPQTEAEFLQRFGALICAIKADKRVFGYCYTQLTDIYQEVNGLYYFDRREKFSPEKLAACQSGPAAYEKEEQ